MTALPDLSPGAAKRWLLTGVPKPAEGLALAEILREHLDHNNCVIHIAVNDREAENMAAALSFFAPNVEQLHFPAWDCMPYDRNSPLQSIMAQRMLTLSSLANSAPGKLPRVIFTTASAILQKLPPREVMRQVGMMLSVKQQINPEMLIHYLITQGYRRSSKAMEQGEFAVRGGIIDIVPPAISEGIRLDFFGNEIESIRSYEPLSQRTQDNVQSIALSPVSEVLLQDDTIARFRTRYRDLFGAISKDDPLYESISQGNGYPGMEHWLPLFYEHTETLFDYCPGLIVLNAQVEEALAEKRDSIMDYYDARKAALAGASKKNSFAGGPVYQPVPPEQAFLMESEWESATHDHTRVALTPFAADTPAPSPFQGENIPLTPSPFQGENISLTPSPFQGENISLTPSPFQGEGGGEGRVRGENPHPALSLEGRGFTVPMNYRTALRFAPISQGKTPFEQLSERVAQMSAEKKSVLLACFSRGSLERLQTLLLEHGFHPVRIEKWTEIKTLASKSIGLAVLPLEHGFESERALILSEQDVLGERIARTPTRKKKSDIFMQEAANFTEGELVTHKEHGIGRFEGLVTLSVLGATHDCLKILYDEGAKLFLPVENIDMLTRFGLEEEGIKLDKLGGASWQARKAKLKERILLAAEELLKTAALRLIKTAEIMEAPTGSYDDFCSRFPYIETDDQARAIADVIEDLHSGKPMDRLVCGDVGFGKTEVALRAAFVAVCNVEHKIQVAIIAPTTLLARQHYHNFCARFEGFPVTIRQLSRMVPTKEQKRTREQLAAGEVDIVIGTHALLSKQVEFKNLGLLVVDEEQHFGVAQKEKLKSLKSGVHVLTLSATPIPRTLQMALTGVRDLSLITTPPVDRLAVRSFVMPFDTVVIHEAIARELHRGGRCFVVCPRIKDIAEIKAQVSELVPDARLAVAHGQMPPTQLEDIMTDFYEGKYDLLLSTAIIESGLDIPSANTIIIFNAHLFGLGQLYQMRGRVGRSKLRAYAYFILPYRKQISKTATRRLEIMQTLDSLGAGFTLASHDMDLRGFGNLVGEEQSGHIREVGIELYQQMLEDAVAQLKHENNRATSDTAPTPAPEDWSPQINLGLSVLIPESYVDDLQLRLGLYRRAAALISEDEINSFAAELVDRFGDMPEETRHLISTLSLKQACKKAHIERLDTGPKGAVLSFRNNVVAEPEKLMLMVEKNPRRLKIRPDQKLVFTQEWLPQDDKIAVLRRLAEQIAVL